jgi:2'-5' RNA ligase
MAFIGIKVPHPEARLLSGIEVPGEKEGTSELHITLLCFEKNWPISEITKALDATYNVISEIKPFLVTVEKIGCFPKRDDEPCPIIAKVKSDDLHDLCDKLKKEFDKCDVDYSKVFKDYKPHITLSYADEELDECKIDTIEFSVSEIVLWGGDHGDDRIFITFPLKGPETHKHSLLTQKADIFQKIAGNPPQNYLTPSFERRGEEREHLSREDALRILNLSKTFTKEELKSSMRHLARKHHPDFGGDSGKFKEVMKAFKLLEKSPSKSNSKSNFTEPPWGDWYKKYVIQGQE